MYLRHKLIKIFKIKNIILTVLSAFSILVSAYYLISLCMSYRGDLNVVLNAKSSFSSIVSIIVGIVILILVYLSKTAIGNAFFYSRYFEEDLDGVIGYSELSKIIEKSEHSIRNQLKLYLKLYMKNFKLVSDNSKDYILLESKKYLCECKNCGANIEKSEYFTGICPYCKSSDLLAKVITDDKFYSIKTDISEKKKTADFYVAKGLKAKFLVYVSILCLLLPVIIINIPCSIDYICKSFDKDYLESLILSGEAEVLSYSVIKNDLLTTALLCILITVINLPFLYYVITRIISISITTYYSSFFSKVNTHSVLFSKIPAYSKSKRLKKDKIKCIRKAICYGYLLNCTFENYKNNLRIALAKKVVKDECPYCGAPIVGAVNENYKCRYCGNMIMEVVKKKQ